MKKNMNMNMCSNILILALIVSIIYVSISNNNNLRTLGNRLTSGQINTVLILVIITLILTENIQIGLLVTILYLLMLIRFNSTKQQENFESDYGPNPLACDTYGDNKNGTSFYPLHA